MKRCPACQRAYTDDTLTYCLEDGTALAPDRSDASGMAATLIIPDPRQTAAPPVPEAFARPHAYPAPQPPPQIYGAPQPLWSQPVAAPAPYAASQTKQGRGAAVTSLVCAVAAFFLFGFCLIAGASGVDNNIIGGIFLFSLLVALIGAVLSILAIYRMTRHAGAHNSKALAVAGLVLNSLYLVLCVILLIISARASS